MRRLLLSLVIACAALAAGAAVSAQETEPPACTAETAVPATIAQVNSDFDNWRGKCVAIEALRYERWLYADRPALADQPVEERLDDDAFTADEIRRSRILPINRDGSELPSSRPHRVRAIGRVHACQDAYAWAEEERKKNDGFIMLGGFCHYTRENFIVPVALEDLGGGSVTRLTEAELPPDRRRLREATPQQLQDAAPHVAVAQSWIGAFTAGDRAALLRLEFPDYDTMVETRTRGEPYEALEEDFAAFAADYDEKAELLAFVPALERASRPVKLFVEYEQDATGEFVPADRYYTGYTSCWCKGPDCDGKWPVLAWDTDNDPARPYFCIDTYEYGSEEEYVISPGVPLSETGFLEPDWPD